MRLSDIHTLSAKQKAALRTGNITDVDTFLLLSPADIARRCRITPAEAENIAKAVCRAYPAAPATTVANLLSAAVANAIFTTGDEALDEVLGGGMQTGMVWEVCGESAAGKTQLALQLALTVQLPPSLCGLSGSVCYLTTRRTLPTERLLQIAHAHPLLADSFPGLTSLVNIQTRAAPDAQQLLYVLVTGISSLIRELEESYKPALRLVIIDTLAEVFHTSTRTTTASLVERSQTLGLASTALHTLASTHNLSILVLNEVSDVFADYQSGELGELIYRDHARWFSRAEGVPGIEMKEAALGLAWANQPNARIMLSRTERRRYLDLPTSPVAKRRRLSLDPELNMDDMDVVGANGPTLVRRLTVLFSSVSPPAALDYIVTTAGVSTLPSVEDFPLADVDARSDVFDLDAAEEEDLLNALAEVEGRTQAAVADTLKPPDSGVVEAVVLDPLEPPDSEGVEEAESDPLGDTVVDQLAEPLEDDDFFVGDEMTLDEEDLLALEDGPSVEAFPQAAE